MRLGVSQSWCGRCTSTQGVALVLVIGLQGSVSQSVSQQLKPCLKPRSCCAVLCRCQRRRTVSAVTCLSTSAVQVPGLTNQRHNEAAILQLGARVSGGSSSLYSRLYHLPSFLFTAAFTLAAACLIFIHSDLISWLRHSLNMERQFRYRVYIWKIFLL